MLLGLHLQLDEIAGAVVVDVVAGVDGRGLGAVVVHGDGVGGCGVLLRCDGPVDGRGDRGCCNRDTGERFILLARPHLDHHLHVVGGAVAARPPVQVHGRGRGDEVVGLARLELQRRGVGAEAPERYGKVAEALRLVAHCHNLWSRVGDPAAEVLVLGHAVDDVLLPGVGTDDVQLVVLRGHAALVHLQHVVRVIQPEDGVGTVPVHKVGVGRSHALVHQHKQQQAQVHVHGVRYLCILSFFV